MSNIIGVDAAKLAGLQIDMLQKLRKGQMTLDHIEWFNGLTKDARNRYAAGEKIASKPATPVEVISQPEKFGLIKDLGIITVPDGYDHATRLATFGKEHGKKFYYYNENITDQNFSKATVQLTPGRKLRVKAFKQIISGRTTSEERIAFLKSQNAVLTGAQGASIVFEQKRDELPRGYWYASFDEKDALWKDADGDHRVPGVHCHSDGGFHFSLGGFEDGWYEGDCLLCFCDFNESSEA